MQKTNQNYLLLWLVFKLNVMHVVEGTRGEIQPAKLDQTMSTQMPLNTSNYGKQQEREKLKLEKRAMRRMKMARRNKRRKGTRKVVFVDGSASGSDPQAIHLNCLG